MCLFFLLDGINNAYANVGGLFAFFQLFQAFEIAFTIVGWTGSKSVLFPTFQVKTRDRSSSTYAKSNGSSDS